MNTATPALLTWRRPPGLASTRTIGFTLVELLVVMVILSILGSLSLAGLNVGRQRSKADKTRSTIAKINSVVQEMYDDFATRPISDAMLPKLMTYEMPDQWVDVRTESELAGLPESLRTGPVNRYARMVVKGASRTAMTDADRAAFSATLANAECLWLCVARSGFQPDVLEQFRPDELSDLDNDGAKEFVDGWGKPIFFLRWAPGFVYPLSPVQTQSDINTALSAVPGSSGPGAKSWRTVIAMLTPLIYSAGPDEAGNDTLSGPDGYGIQRANGPRTSPFSPFEFPDIGAPRTGTSTPNAYRDNITNHDIMVR